LSVTVYLLITNIVVALLDTFELAILGWITSITAKIKMRFSALYNMAIYSLTLSMILNMIYIIINCFTKFTISYFQVAYITIAYVYLAASIFILKDDFMKKQEEVEKIKQEQKKVREEIKEQEEQKQEKSKKRQEKEKKKEDEDEDNNNQGEEPKGSEA
jgi:type III secretory pathway component EscU